MLEGATLLVGELGFPEGPRWHDDRLWFSDFRTKKIMTVTLDGHTEIVGEVPGQPSGLGWLPDNRLLAVSMLDRRLMRLTQNGLLVEVANLWELASYHCNDMVVSKEGRAYIGNFGLDLDADVLELNLAEIIMVTPDGEASIVADELAFPNGSVITPDGNTLIVAESLAARLTAFTIGKDGSLSHRRVWAQFDDLGVGESKADYVGRVVPDGICLDAEGGIWVASPGNNNPAILHIREGGEITHRLEGAIIPYACMLGGQDGRTLFIAGTATNDTGHPLPEPNGCILTLRVDVSHDGLP